MCIRGALDSARRLQAQHPVSLGPFGRVIEDASYPTPGVDTAPYFAHNTDRSFQTIGLPITFHEGTGKVDDALSFDVLAASLRQDTRDLAVFSEVLAKKLEQAVPHWVQIDRRGGLFQKNPPVRRITVTFDPWQYVLDSDRGRVNTARVKMVRGVAIKTEPLDLNPWIDALSQDMVEAASREAQARESLERFLIQP